ncbi:MAG: hypothetical protein WD669_08375 [Pirellulales bacterium]
MSKRLPVPPDLEHLIEKRDGDEDRRQAEHRASADRRGEDDLGPLGAIESTSDLRNLPTDDRRADEPRRQKKDRRGKRRRKADS